MMSHLPPDLVEEILSRVPATSFKRLRSTFKLWNALFKNPRFTEKHFRKAPKESLVLMLKEYRVCPMIVNLNVSGPSIEFKDALDLNNYPPNSKEVDIHEVFHCDGLLLCRTMDNRLVLWNPCLGETRWIQTKPKDMYSKFALGYEKNKSGHIYKILKFLDNTPYGRVDEFEIYDFSSDSWRVLDAIAFDCFILSDIGFTLKGNTYWRALDQVNYSQFVLNFDFTAERFTRLCLSPFQNVGMLALSVVEGKNLSIFIQRDSPSKMEMWVTNQIDANIEALLKWSKSFTVDIPFRCDYFPFVMSYLIDEEKKVVVCIYNEYFGENSEKVYIIGEDNAYYTEIPSFAESTNKLEGLRPIIFNYVPSLVRIQQGR